MLYIIILCAILIFLFVCCFIYRNNVWNYIKSKLPKRKNKNKPTSESKPKQEKPKEIKYEDFIPISKETHDNQVAQTDNSLINLLEGDEDFFSDNFFDFDFNLNEKTTDDLMIEKSSVSDMDYLNKSIKKPKNKSIATKIKELPPEIKALIFDGTINNLKDDKIFNVKNNKKN